jgi:hypothetical protein
MLDFSRPAAFTAGAATGGAAARPPTAGGAPAQRQAAVQEASRAVVEEKLIALGIADLARDEGAVSTFDELAPLKHLQALDWMPRRGLQPCTISRSKGTLLDRNVRFVFSTDRAKMFLLAGRKRANKATSNYLVSLRPDDLERKSESFYGKVRANATGTEYIIYDRGERPGVDDDDVEVSGAREELGCVIYAPNVGGAGGPRRIIVVLPPPADSEGTRSVRFRPTKPEDSILAHYHAGTLPKGCIVLQSKAPKWNEALRSYQLDFGGRVGAASIKNFQLVEASNPTRTVLQFGKREDETYSCDFQAPVTARLAFMISMTAFDGQLTRE